MSIIHGNIVDEAILKGKDAIVLPSNPKMRYGMGVSEAIFRKAGIEALERHCEDAYGVGYEPEKRGNDMKPTEVRVTPGFGIGMDILFVQSPNDVYFDIPEADLMPLLRKTYANLLRAILKKGYRSVLLPSLGTGHYGFSHEDVAKWVVPMLDSFCAINEGVDLFLCLADRETERKYEKAKGGYFAF